MAIQTECATSCGTAAVRRNTRFVTLTFFSNISVTKQWLLFVDSPHLSDGDSAQFDWINCIESAAQTELPGKLNRLI